MYWTIRQYGHLKSKNTDKLTLKLKEKQDVQGKTVAQKSVNSVVYLQSEFSHDRSLVIISFKGTHTESMCPSTLCRLEHPIAIPFKTGSRFPILIILVCVIVSSQSGS